MTGVLVESTQVWELFTGVSLQAEGLLTARFVIYGRFQTAPLGHCSVS